MKKIYICHTYYHLYNSLLEVLYEKKKAFLILCNQIQDVESLCVKLKNTNLYEEIFLLDDISIQKEIFGDKKISTFQVIKKRFEIYNKYSKRLFFLDDIKAEYIVFNDAEIIFQYIYFKFDKFILIEDGMRVYENIKFIKVKRLLFYIFKMPFLLQDGRSDKIKSIKVADQMKILDKRKDKTLKILELEDVLKENKYVNSYLNNVFCFNLDFFSMDKKKKRVLILTQPLSEDGLVDEDLKIKFYNKLIKKFCEEYDEVYIKSHPRDNSKYSKKCRVISKNMPSELLNILKKDYFDMGIAVYSTAIANLKVAKEKKNILDSFKNLESEMLRILNEE